MDWVSAESGARRGILTKPHLPRGLYALHDTIVAAVPLGTRDSELEKALARIRVLAPTALETHRRVAGHAYARRRYADAVVAFRTVAEATGRISDEWRLALCLDRLGDRRAMLWLAARQKCLPGRRPFRALLLSCLAVRRARRRLAVALGTGPGAAINREIAPGPAGLVGLSDVAAAVVSKHAMVAVEKRGPAPGPILVISADPVYHDRFSDLLAASLKTLGTGLRIHFHGVGPERAFDLSCMSDILAGVSFDAEGGGDRAYATVSRFLALPSIMAAWRRPVLLTDIDSAFHADPATVFSSLDGRDLGLQWNDTSMPWEAVGAGFVALSDSVAARRFAERVAAVLHDRWRRGALAYYSDQGALLSAWLHESATSAPPSMARLKGRDWLFDAFQSGPAAKRAYLEARLSRARRPGSYSDA